MSKPLISLIAAGMVALASAAPARESVAPAGARPYAGPVGPGSLSGIWVKIGEPSGLPILEEMYEPREEVLTTGDGTPLPAQPWAAELIEQRLKDAEAGHPFADTQSQCLPAGVPHMMFEFGPMQFLETPGQVTILRQQFTFFRIIHMGGDHPKDLDPTFLGHSVGHWEGDTLVVDTIGLRDDTTIKVVIPHSEQMHVIERYRRLSDEVLEIRATIDDPKTFTRPWLMVTQLKPLRTPLTEFFCENNRNVRGPNGTLVVRPASSGP